MNTGLLWKTCSNVRQLQPRLASDTAYFAQHIDNLRLHLHLGHLADAFILLGTYNKYISQKKEKQYVAVGTVRMFRETTTKH